MQSQYRYADDENERRFVQLPMRTGDLPLCRATNWPNEKSAGSILNPKRGPEL
ncbi:hypothetical protein PP1Y_Lpl1205 (plasmid) [Novosphingobium sp. PP1Y]|nr:hypothetical protein PP1Y_Lpl1205 [Novosphingobium sp. PP1Y]